MGKSTPSPPPAPDPTATASAQGAANVQTAIANTALNNPNVYSPYGSSTFQQTGTQKITMPDGSTQELPTYTQNISLNPNQAHMQGQNEALGIQTNDIAAQAQNSIGWSLEHPMQSGDIASVRASAGATPTLATGYGTTANATGYDQGGQIQSSVPFGQAATGFGNTAQGIQGSVPVGQAATSFGNTAQNVQGQIGGTAGGIQYNVDTAGINQARDAATNAALARLQPSMDQQNAQLEARLANQGVSLGSSAYGSAMFNQGQQQNDLRLGAVQVGDAEQQALYGQALQSGQFNNAAQAQDFDQQSQRGAFANAAQAQDYAQQQGRGQFQQAGVAQNNAANLAAGQFANSAQAQDFGQQQARGQFQQQGVTANNASALAAGTFANAAQGQQNAENAAQAQFYNSGVNANNATAAAQAAFGNTAAAQDYQNRLAGATFHNQASAQQLSQGLALANQQINQIGALRSGGQVANYQGPNYSAGTLDQTPISSDVYATAGLQNQQYMAQLQNSAANTAALGSALGGIGGALTKAGPKSDVRLKTNIVPFARARNGLTIYAYEMPAEAPGWHLGFMAHEVALLHPDAVWTDPDDGWARVDYEKAVA